MPAAPLGDGSRAMVLAPTTTLNVDLASNNSRQKCKFDSSDFKFDNIKLIIVKILCYLFSRYEKEWFVVKRFSRHHMLMSFLGVLVRFLHCEQLSIQLKQRGCPAPQSDNSLVKPHPKQLPSGLGVRVRVCGESSAVECGSGEVAVRVMGRYSAEERESMNSSALSWSIRCSRSSVSSGNLCCSSRSLVSSEKLC